MRGEIIISGLKWLAGKQPHTLTLDECARAAHVGFGGWLFIIPCASGAIHHFGVIAIGKLLWLYLLTGIVSLLASTSYKDCVNCALIESAKIKNVWIDLNANQITAATSLVLM